MAPHKKPIKPHQVTVRFKDPKDQEALANEFVKSGCKSLSDYFHRLFVARPDKDTDSMPDVQRAGQLSISNHQLEEIAETLRVFSESVTADHHAQFSKISALEDHQSEMSSALLSVLENETQLTDQIENLRKHRPDTSSLEQVIRIRMAEHKIDLQVLQDLFKTHASPPKRSKIKQLGWVLTPLSIMCLAATILLEPFNGHPTLDALRKEEAEITAKILSLKAELPNTQQDLKYWRQIRPFLERDSSGNLLFRVPKKFEWGTGIDQHSRYIQITGAH
ncbi:hypothetical protein [Actomonas aquatica]|uniref:Uncharacterized protein n=1 Tax=Actomonas aquatica TaxID=2866162 RepID=A0ABZ1C9I7_9BACT|nr:hypothetical protein [Opitutus sp. WL0086]WRQ88067.1 hypothetical protein K1X11_001525 [Opitutus sp. WL0086]